MKLSIATIAFFVGVVSASNNNNNNNNKSLRASNNGKETVVESSDMQASVILGGVKGEPSAADLDVIGKAFVATYNDAHWEADHAMLGNHATESVGWTCRFCDDDDDRKAKSDFEFGITTPVSWTCRFCDDDDDRRSKAKTEETLGEITPEMEVAFCNRIRSSGSEYLKAATSCSLGHKSQSAKKDVNADLSPVGIVDTTLVVKGVEGGIQSAADRAVIAKAYTAAYNQMHWNDSHYLSEPEAKSTDLGWTCRFCDDDDDRSKAVTSVVEVASPVIEWTCRFCDDDDDRKAKNAAVGWTCRFCDDDDDRRAKDVFTAKSMEDDILAKIRAAGGKFAKVTSVSIARAQTLTKSATA